MTLGILSVVAFLTATLSAVIGMGGGMLLLAALFAFMPHASAIPTHACVQLVSNSTRTLVFLPHVEWPAVGRFLIGVIPGSFIGVAALVLLGDSPRAEPWLKLLVGAYILGSLAIPARPSGDRRLPGWSFPLLGLAAGAAAFTVGAVGPLIGPLFARGNFKKEALVATKAVFQSLLHLAKIPTFLLVRSYPNLAELGALTLAMAIMAVLGTLLGRRLIHRVSERAFLLLYRIALTIAGLKVLIFDGLKPLLLPG